MDKISNYKVTEQEIKQNGVQAVQGEVLYGDPAENKRLFDRLVTFAISKYNAAIEWLVDKAHVHENSELLESVKQENVHSHGNKGLLDSIKEKNVHDHWNKETLDGLNKNMVAAWNMAAGIEEWGATDMDCGGFPDGLMVFQVKRGKAASMPELANGEFGLADGELHIGTPSGNMLLVSERNIIDEETIQLAQSLGFLSDDSDGNTGGDSGGNNEGGDNNEQNYSIAIQNPGSITTTSSRQLSVDITKPENAVTHVEWFSGNGSVASIERNTGLLTPHAAGSVPITAQLRSGEGSATVTAAGSLLATDSITLNIQSDSASSGYGYQGLDGNAMKLTNPSGVRVASPATSTTTVNGVTYTVYNNQITGRVTLANGTADFGYTMSAGMNNFNEGIFNDYVGDIMEIKTPLPPGRAGKEGT